MDFVSNSTSPLRLIGMALGNQLFDDLDHLRDVFGRARLDGRIKAAESRGIFEILRLGLFGDQRGSPR